MTGRCVIRAGSSQSSVCDGSVLNVPTMTSALCVTTVTSTTCVIVSFASTLLEVFGNKMSLSLLIENKTLILLLDFNHFSTTGRCSGTAHYNFSIRQAAINIAAFVTSSFKIFLTRGQLFRDVEPRVICQFFVSLSGSLLNILQLFMSFSQNPKLLQHLADGINYTSWRFAAICFRPFI